VSRLTLDRFLDIRGDQMRLMRFVDYYWTETARDYAARQALAEVVRLFFVVRFVAHALCPLQQIQKTRTLVP